MRQADIDRIDTDFTIFYGMYTTQEMHIESGVLRDGMQPDGPGRVAGTGIPNGERATVLSSPELPPKLFTIFTNHGTLDITEIQFCFPDRSSDEFDHDKQTYPDLYSFFPDGKGGGDIFRIATWPAEKLEVGSMLYEIRLTQLKEIIRASSRPGTIEHNVSGHIFEGRREYRMPESPNESIVVPLIAECKKALGMDLGLPEL